MKLISMTDFVLQRNLRTAIDIFRSMSSCSKYANFLKQPLTLGMFIPCDDDSNILEEPLLNCNKKCPFKGDYSKCCKFELFNRAQSKVIFEGFAISEAGGAICDKSGIFNIFWLIDNNWKLSKGIKTIEDLVSYNLDLTGSF